MYDDLGGRVFDINHDLNVNGQMYNIKIWFNWKSDIYTDLKLLSLYLILLVKVLINNHTYFIS